MNSINSTKLLKRARAKQQTFAKGLWYGNQGKDLLRSVDASGADYPVHHFHPSSKGHADADLATLYNVETKVLVQAVKRNIDRFPEDFMFQLTQQEFDDLKSQIVTSS